MDSKEDSVKHRERTYQYRREHPDYHKLALRKFHFLHHKEYNEKCRNWWREIRKKAIKKLGGKCVYCGCTDYRALEFNHVEGKGREAYRVLSNARTYLRIARGTYDGPPIEIACRVCNAVHYLRLKGIEGFEVIWNGNRSSK
jgi:23S rRNA maturation-related 3'-5' exoribonuclease YhaM